jgi:hypothetical protein
MGCAHRASQNGHGIAINYNYSFLFAYAKADNTGAKKTPFTIAQYSSKMTALIQAKTAH